MVVLLIGGPANGQTVSLQTGTQTIIIPGIGVNSEWYSPNASIPPDYTFASFKHYYSRALQERDGMPIYRFTGSTSEAVTLPALWTQL